MYLNFEIVIGYLEFPAGVASKRKLSFWESDGDRGRLLGHHNCHIKFGMVQKRGDLLQKYLKGIFLKGLDL